MKSPRLPSCLALLPLLAGCYSGPAPTLRANFSGELRLEAKCIEYKRDPELLAKVIADQYQDGWRLAYVSEAHYGLFGFGHIAVQVCYERPLAGRSSKVSASTAPAPSGGGNDLVGPPLAAAPPPPPTLEQAQGAYDQENYAGAITMLEPIAAGKTNDDESHVQGAQFLLGKAHFKLKHYTESLFAFTVIANKGHPHSYFGKSLPWLVQLSHAQPTAAGVLLTLAKYELRDIEHPALESLRDELYYLLGQSRLSQGEQQEGLELLGKVRAGTPFHEQARRLVAVHSTKKP